MKRTTIGLIVITLSLGLGCGSGDDAITCDDGQVCPAPNMCMPDGGCIPPPQEAFCETNADGELCDPGDPSEPGDGECQDGACVLLVCGDNDVKGNEVCDGNIGASSCVAAGFDYGTPSCGDDCRADDLGRCGNIGWTNISPGAPESDNRAIFAIGNEIWVGATEAGYYHDGVGWNEDSTLNAVALHGTSRTNVWGVFPNANASGSVARRFDGTSWGADESLPGIATDVFVASESEVYAVGKNDIGGAVWRRDAGEWVLELEDEDLFFLNEFTVLGKTLVILAKSGVGAVMVSRVAGEWSTREFQVQKVSSIWGESLDDFFVTAISPREPNVSRTVHFTARGPQPLAQGVGPLVNLGDSLFSLSPTQMTQIALNVADTPSRLVLGPGSNERDFIVDAVVAGNRIVAATEKGVHTFYGNGYTILPDLAQGARVVATSRWGSDLTAVLASSDGSLNLSVTTDAFGDSPSSSSVSIPFDALTDIWATKSGGFFLHNISGAGVLCPYNPDGSGCPIGLTIADDILYAIDGSDDSTVAMAVGDGGELWVYNGIEWQKEVVAEIGSTNLRAVREVDGAFLVAGEAGALFVRAADGVWQVVDSGTSASLHAIDGTPEAFWAVGANGAVVRCAASVCMAESIVDEATFTDISVVAADDIFAVGGSKSFHFDGLRWSPLSSGKNITSVFASERVVWFGNAFDQNFYLERVERAVSWVATP